MREVGIELNQVIVEILVQHFSDARAARRAITVLAGTSEQMNAWIVPLNTPDFIRGAVRGFIVDKQDRFLRRGLSYSRD
jgi:hypothetical protein